MSAQRRPGPKPRRRHGPGHRPPATTERGPSLNEGRGRSPGDGGVCLPPSLELRRRSTKAGAEAPATAQSDAVHPAHGGAQRRPGPKPRRRSAPSAGSSGGRRPLNEGRGRSPGDGGVSTPRPPTPGSALNEGRGRSPGDGCAQPGRLVLPVRSLNEGRGRSPGDGGDLLVRVREGRPRSTKAGAEAPATAQGPDVEGGAAVERSTKAGAEAPATASPSGLDCLSASPLNEGRGRSPGDGPVEGHCAGLRRRRSTKAGAEAPATGPRWLRCSPSTAPLNEGRGRSPGDGPGLVGGGVGLCGRSTKAGAEAPATAGRPPNAC